LFFLAARHFIVTVVSAAMSIVLKPVKIRIYMKKVTEMSSSISHIYRLFIAGFSTKKCHRVLVNEFTIFNIFTEYL
jgi:hypothetical protein